MPIICTRKGRIFDIVHVALRELIITILFCLHIQYVKFAEIPHGIFVTYLSSFNGSLASPTMAAFNRTSGSCASYIQLSSGNHYAITDWNPHSAPYQVRCIPKCEHCVTSVSVAYVGIV